MTRGHLMDALGVCLAVVAAPIALLGKNPAVVQSELRRWQILAALLGLEVLLGLAMYLLAT